MLVIVIWIGGVGGLIGVGDNGWGTIAAIASMFILGCYALASVTEDRWCQNEIRWWVIGFLFAGGTAAISVHVGGAALLMFLLAGFALNWWGTAKGS